MVDIASNSSATDDSNSKTSPLGVRILAMFVVGSFATWLCCFAVESVGIVYPTPAAVLSLGANPTVEERAAAASAKFQADSGNAMVWLGATGAILGGVLALAMGFLRRAGIRILFGTLAGVVLAAGMGCLAGYVCIAFHDSLTATMIGGSSDSEHQFMKMHGLTWGLIGIGIGIACGLTRSVITLKLVCLSTIVACIAGCIAGVSFPLLVAVFAPLADSSFPFPEPGVPRVVWIGLSSIITGLGLARTG